MKKSILVFFTSFRRKPESSLCKALQISWTPVFTRGVTAIIQFFHTFGEGGVGAMFLEKNVPRLDPQANSKSDNGYARQGWM